MNPHPAEESLTGLSTADYVRHLWRRRLWIVGLTLAAFFLFYAGLVAFHKNSFEARALIMVRDQPRMTIADDDRPGIAPPAFRSMFTADDTIEFVRRQYNDIVERRALFAADDPDQQHFPIEAPLEKYRYKFATRSAATVDTTITTRFSPVIELSVKGESRGQALAMMNLWVNHILEKYGNLLNEEADFLRQSTRVRSARLQEEMAAAVAERAAIESRERLVAAQFASAMRRLTYASVPPTPVMVGTDVTGYTLHTGARSAELSIDQVQAGIDPGFYERLAMVELEITRLEGANDDARAGEAAGLRAERDRLASLITETEAAMNAVGVELAAVHAELARLDVEINRLEYAVRLNSTVASQSEALFRETNPEATDHTRYGTLRLLSEPVLPNLRVWPKRVLLCSIAAGTTFLLMLIAFCGEVALRAILRDERAA